MPAPVGALVLTAAPTYGVYQAFRGLTKRSTRLPNAGFFIGNRAPRPLPAASNALMPTPLQGCEQPLAEDKPVAWLLNSDRIADSRYENLAKAHKCGDVTKDPAGLPHVQYLCDSCATTKAKLRGFGQPTRPIAS
jgi:hypothetical protein